MYGWCLFVTTVVMRSPSAALARVYAWVHIKVYTEITWYLFVEVRDIEWLSVLRSVVFVVLGLFW